MSRYRVGTLFARIGLVATATTLLVGVGAPAMATAFPQPTSLVSHGDVVADSTKLIINAPKVKNDGTAALTFVYVEYELIPASATDSLPFQFMGGGDHECGENGTIPHRLVGCFYRTAVEPGATLDVTTKLDLELTGTSTTSPTPSLKISVGTGSQTIPITRTKVPPADLTVTIAGHRSGHVGDVVDVPWTVTNHGPGTVPKGSLTLRLTPPPGTVWTGPAASLCRPPVPAPPAEYVCKVDDEVAPGQATSETWQLKIVSTPVGTGKIWVYPMPFIGGDPYRDMIDPKPADNTVLITIDTETGTGGTAGGAPGAGAPGTGNGLPVTGTNAAIIAAAGVTVLLAGVGLLLIRRRRIAFTIDD